MLCLARRLRRDAGAVERLKHPVLWHALVEREHEVRRHVAPAWGLVHEERPGGPDPFWWERY